ncbi:unnamed protein product [Phytomonas sp. EM1]|nr:unnamed protein product [Phytomonas sp. EM1]|eukprot:CCW61735.1 unnamed protein product [Phytomonas sp. isolate EM1]
MSAGGENYYKISHAFERRLNVPLLPGLATVGRFFPSNVESAASLSASRIPRPAPCLACASTGQRVVLHNNNTNTALTKRSAKLGESLSSLSVPGEAVGGPKGGGEGSLHLLNFGKEATGLAAGPFGAPAAVPGQPLEALLFAAATSLLAYDVAQGREVFHRDVEDGVRAVACRPTGEVLALVGSNCSVYGFDQQGGEAFWAVTGDEVSAMALLRWGDRDDPPALLAASEDHEIRVFAGEEVVASLLEAGRVRQLVTSTRGYDGPSSSTSSPPPPAGRFAYLLDNGTVGVYQHTQRVWRVKSQHVPVSAAFCDVDDDGVEELVIGYESGRVEVRSDIRTGSGNRGGEVLYRGTYAAPVAAVLSEDYRQDGRPIPLVCTVDGVVRGLTLPSSKLEEADEVRNTQVLASLVQQQRLLETQLSGIEEQLSLQQKGEQDLTLPEAGLRVAHTARYRWGGKMLEIVLSLHNAPEDAVIQSCVLCTDNTNLSKEGSDAVCFYADSPSSCLVCPVEYTKNVATTVNAHVSVGSAFAANYQVHELSFRIPPFIAYQPRAMRPEQNSPAQAPVLPSQPAGYVEMSYRENLRMDALETWLRENFCIPNGFALYDLDSPVKSALRADLVSARGDGSVVVEINNPEGGYKTITVRADSMGCCADVIASLGADVVGGVAEQGAHPFKTECDFPEELERLRQELLRVEAFDAARMRLAADMANAATTVKTLLVRAEDARLLDDMVNMKKAYTSLYNVNSELLDENTKRLNNHKELKAALNEVNSFIQWAGKLRLGPDKVNVIALCRNALKEWRITSLIEIIRSGSA